MNQQKNPLEVLTNFLENEKKNEVEKKYRELRIAGYVMSISYNQVVVTTNDAYKQSVGGIPKSSLLIMVPENYENFPSHFTLLRVIDTAETPLSKEVQQTYFELHKRSMPELDPYTSNELQWGAINTEVLGMFYIDPDDSKKIEFSGDVNNLDSPHKYKVYSPDESILDLIVNGLVPQESRFTVGYIRQTECRLRSDNKKYSDIPVIVSTNDFKGTRTAMFGKTRMGKSNVIKIIAQSIIETTSNVEENVGQLIFDIDGEYANDNEQDDRKSLKTVYPDVCTVYAFNPKRDDVKPLKYNFYEHPERSLTILRKFLEQDRRDSIYVKNFATTELPSVEEINSLPHNEKLRTRRRILAYWAVLHEAGFAADEERLKSILEINPNFKNDLRLKIYDEDDENNLPVVNSLETLVTEFEKLADFVKKTKNDDPLLVTSSKNPLLAPEDISIIEMLMSSTGRAGPKVISSYKRFHDMNAGDTNNEIIKLLDEGKTVILDLANAQPELVDHYSEDLSRSVFQHQVEKFTDNKLENDYIQLYFEEAHNIFPKDDTSDIDIYRRIAKEGAKYHLGMVYSTQSVTSINKDLLAQTENFFVTHLSSKDEVSTLARVNNNFTSLAEDVLLSRTVGYIKMLTRSHRFVVSVQVKKFEPKKKSGSN